MVLELVLIGGIVYYYVKKNKQEKLKKAAFQAGEPFFHKDGTVTYPPNYPNLPSYTATQQPVSQYSRQIPIQGEHNSPVMQPYTDAVPRKTSVSDEKGPLVVETREVMKEKN